MRVTVVATGFDNKSASDLRNSINNAMGGAQSVPSAVFSSDTGASAAPASNAPRLLLRLKRRPWKRKAATIVTTTSCWLF